MSDYTISDLTQAFTRQGYSIPSFIDNTDLEQRFYHEQFTCIVVILTDLISKKKVDIKLTKRITESVVDYLNQIGVINRPIGLSYKAYLFELIEQLEQVLEDNEYYESLSNFKDFKKIYNDYEYDSRTKETK